MNRGGEIDFASEDLGLAPVVGDLEGDDFDAFNDDTFGAEDVWVEDDHEELAKFTEEERQAMQETDGFFDFDNAGHHSPLEPEPHGDGHAQNGRQDLQSPRHQHHHELSDLAREIDDKMRFGSPAAHLNQHQHHQLPPTDPAIVNVMRFPPVPMMPPFLPPGAHPMAPPHFPPFQQAPNFPGPMPHGLHDPAVMSMGQIPPHLLLLQQQQLQRQLNPMMNQPPPPQQNKPGGIRTVEEIERQLLSDQHQNELRQQQQQQQARFHHHQQQQHQFQQQQQQARFQQHQQQQRHNHHGQNYGNTGRHQNQFNQQQQQSRYRNNFDDKNRETFGDDFVEHHAVQQRQQQQHGNHLITPGHVHVLGILRGARERTRGPGPSMPQTESTGNPMRDLELQRMATARRFDRDEQPHSNDEYAGLMSQRERQWIINIQLSQLKCENPFLDDYYFTVFNLRKQHQQYISAGNDDRLDETSKTGHDDSSENHGGHEGGVRQPKREEEGAQLLIQPDSPRNPYTPLQFSNSLGKLQAATVKAPRKIIDVGILNTDTSESVSQKDSRNFKLTLLELERLYNLLIEVEDCEKKLLALPTNTSMRVQVEEERDEAVKKFGTNLTGGNRLKRYLTVRKGKTLMKRGLRLLDDLQMGLVCTNLIQHFTSILRKDREEQLLSDFWDNGLRRHFLGAPFELVHHYLTLLTAQTYSVKSFVAAPLGCSILIAVVHQAAVLLQDQNENGEAIQKVLMALGGKLNESNELGRPLRPFNMQLPNCGLSESCMQQLGRLQKIGNSI